VDNLGLRKRRWILTPQAFEKLLDRLDASRDVAGEKYERLRTRLVRFFDWRGCPSPEDQADETLNRIARRLEEGEQIKDLTSYAGGVARNLALEIIKEEEKARLAFRHMPALQEVPAPADVDRCRDCLDRSLARLPPESQALILGYYEAERGAKIENRRALAERLGVPVNVLRVRVHRLRARLEHQVSECMSRSRIGT
jgi:DNA-directed RNA polymerase specialized sigma24 family protein